MCDTGQTEARDPAPRGVLYAETIEMYLPIRGHTNKLFVVLVLILPDPANTLASIPGYADTEACTSIDRPSYVTNLERAEPCFGQE